MSVVSEQWWMYLGCHEKIKIAWLKYNPGPAEMGPCSNVTGGRVRSVGWHIERQQKKYSKGRYARVSDIGFLEK